jgi:hypothetical protein
MVLGLAASSGALTFPGHVGAPFVGHIETDAAGFVPKFG